MRKRLRQILAVTVVAAGPVLSGASSSGVEGADVAVSLSGSGAGVVTRECGGYQAVNEIEVRGRVTPGGPVKGTVQSDHTYGGCGSPNKYKIRLGDGTIVGRIERLFVMATDPAGGTVRGSVVVDRGTGRFEQSAGGSLTIAYDLVYPPAPNKFPYGPTKLKGYTITGTLGSGSSPTGVTEPIAATTGPGSRSPDEPDAACAAANRAAFADAQRLGYGSEPLDAARQREYYSGRAQQVDDLVAALKELASSPNSRDIPASALDSLREYGNWVRANVDTIRATRTTVDQRSPESLESFRSAFGRGVCADLFDMN